MNDATAAKDARYHAMASRVTEADKLLAAVRLFAPENLPALVEHLTNLLDVIDLRLATLEKRLDDALIKPLPEGITDDDVDRYMALPVLDFVTDPQDPWEQAKRLAGLRNSDE